MKTEEFFGKIGGNYQIVLERFACNENLLLKFVKKFPSDPAYDSVSESVKNKDYAQIITGAHTLKGVSANLGFDKLSKSAADLVNELREEKTERTEELFDIISKEYEEVLTYINELD